MRLEPWPGSGPGGTEEQTVQAGASGIGRASRTGERLAYRDRGPRRRVERAAPAAEGSMARPDRPGLWGVQRPRSTGRRSRAERGPAAPGASTPGRRGSGPSGPWLRHTPRGASRAPARGQRRVCGPPAAGTGREADGGVGEQAWVAVAALVRQLGWAAAEGRPVEGATECSRSVKVCEGRIDRGSTGVTRRQDPRHPLRRRAPVRCTIAR